MADQDIKSASVSDLAIDKQIQEHLSQVIRLTYALEGAGVEGAQFKAAMISMVSGIEQRARARVTPKRKALQRVVGVSDDPS